MIPHQIVVEQYFCAIEHGHLAPFRALYFLSQWSYELLPTNIPLECFQEVTFATLPFDRTYMEKKCAYTESLHRGDFVELRAFRKPPVAIDVGLRPLLFFARVMKRDERNLSYPMKSTWEDLRKSIASTQFLQDFNRLNELDGV
eukprot:PhF_6_TR29527/c0_g1_i1/m.43711